MPILMIGTRRSGSNLLRLMLNQLPGVVAPHPPHVMLRMMPLASKYGDLNRDENFSKLIDDVCRLIEVNPVPWEGVQFDRAKIAKRCRSREIVAVFGAVYDAYAEARGARTWVCKSLENLYYLPQIESYFDDAKYVYLYRDGRDVAVSFRKVIVGEKHFYHIAQEWAKAQRLALNQRAITPANRFVSISYEDLTMDPERTIRRLCEIFDIPYDPKLLDFYKSEEAKRTAQSSNVWGNVSKPLIAGNTRKFLREASEEDIRIFESVAGDMLDALGYERAYVKRGEERKFTQAELLQFDAENLRLKEQAVQRTDAADLKRRDLQNALLAEIAQRPDKVIERSMHVAEGVLQMSSAPGTWGMPSVKK